MIEVLSMAHGRMDGDYERWTVTLRNSATGNEVSKEFGVGGVAMKVGPDEQAVAEYQKWRAIREAMRDMAVLDGMDPRAYDDQIPRKPCAT